MRFQRLGLLMLACASLLSCQQPSDVAGKQVMARQDGVEALRSVASQRDEHLDRARHAQPATPIVMPTCNPEAVAKFKATLASADAAAGNPPPWSRGSASAQWVALGRCREALTRMEGIVDAPFHGHAEQMAKNVETDWGVLEYRIRKFDDEWASARAAFVAATP